MGEPPATKVAVVKELIDLRLASHRHNLRRRHRQNRWRRLHSLRRRLQSLRAITESRTDVEPGIGGIGRPRRKEAGVAVARRVNNAGAFGGHWRWLGIWEGKREKRIRGFWEVCECKEQTAERERERVRGLLLSSWCGVFIWLRYVTVLKCVPA